jgi:hypothetical protein
MSDPKPLTMMEAACRFRAANCRLAAAFVRSFSKRSADHWEAKAVEADERAEELRREAGGAA